MKISVILSHPAKGSFNHAIADAVRGALVARGHDVIVHDLHAEGFDPVYSLEELKREAVLPPMVEAHCREICEAEGVVIVHPNYWGRPPAMMCGWVDRVLRSGRAYRFVQDGKGGARPEGLLKLRAAVVFTSGNTPPAVEEAVYGDPLQAHWTKVVFGLCGVTQVGRRNFAPVIVSTVEQRGAWLAEAAEVVTMAFG